MISSRRISKPFYNQFGLLRSKDIVNRRQLSLNCTSSTSVDKSLTKTYRLTTIAENSFKYVSTSASHLAEAKVMQGEGDQGLNLEYDDVLEAQKDESVLIIDVREDWEVEDTGKLPGSIHVPMGDVADVFQNYSEKAFLDKFQKPKPTKDTKLIFSCRSGKRSVTIQEQMIKLGYQKSYNYTGGWLDWAKKQRGTA